MRRSFTTREKVLLVVLAVLILGIGYFKLLLEPINDAVDEYQQNEAAEQDEIIQNTALLAKMQQMQEELEEIRASGTAKPLPTYDNSDAMLVELNTTFAGASDYSLSFGSATALETSSYIMRRPISVSFSAGSYEAAREICDTLHNSSNINQISDLSVSFDSDGEVHISMSISYFELVQTAEQSDEA